MRLRVGLLLCLFGIIAAVGCRKPLTPNVDRNKAPETWITAAPFDTITMERGIPPEPKTIPIRFHVYWAGSDQDGAVSGYYWAVTETLLVSPEGGRPPLPAPRPGDYHFTTRSDSTFIFTVAEDFPDRHHAFYVYSVDDKGKGDPTPARFIFNANDHYPPQPVFDEAIGIGTIYYFDTGGVLRSQVQTFPITDPRSPTTGEAPYDTVPSASRLRFRFHGEIQVPGSVIKGFRFKLDEPQLQPRNPDSLYHKNIVEYHVPPGEVDPWREGADTVAVATGTKVFTLRAVDQANGSKDAYRRFQLNFSPDTWFAGPDPGINIPPWQVLPETGEKYALLVNGRLPAGGLPGTLLNSDSVQTLPVHRAPHKTFLEVYRDSIFLRHEGDTVHLGCWVIIYNGGFDKDSPYQVHVADDIEAIDDSFPGGPVLTKDVQNGSPVGFRSLVTTFLSPNGPVSRTSESRLYPFFDPNDVLNFQRIGAYHPMSNSGEAYSLQRAEDGDGERDKRVEDARQVVLSGNEELRPLVMVFQVNFPPVLETGDPAFHPRADSVETYTTRDWDMRIAASDRDPFISGGNVGGPSEASTLRLRFKVTGKDLDGNPLVFLDPPANGVQQKYVFSGGLPLDVRMQVPATLESGLVTLTIELCDCTFCELNPGEGRCITRDIQVNYVRPPGGPTVTPSRPGLD